MLNDPLANVLSKINNAEKRSKSICTVAPVSKMIETILQLMNENGMIGSFEVTNDGKGKFAVVNLIGKINNCGAIKPRYAVKNFNFEKYEKRYLPAKDFGVLIVSTPAGIMTHIDVKKKQLGGRLIAYCY